MAEVSDIPFLDGEFYEVGGVPEVQFVHDAGPMMVHGAGADAEQLGDLPGRFSLRDQFQDLPFTGCQA
jgi:hypothetical protein